MTNIKTIANSIVHSDLPKQAYAAITAKWGSIGIAIALALVIAIGAVALGYDVADIQAWFAGLGE